MVFLTITIICYLMVNYAIIIGKWKVFKGRRLSPGREVMPVEVKDVLTLMIGSSALIVVLLTLVVAIVMAINHNTKK